MKRVILGLAGLLAFASACALDFNPSLQQLNHRAFTRLEGAPSAVYALAQTTDGMLWIGSSTGLTRFDGVKFVGYPERSDDPLPSTNISALLSAPDGGFWIGFRFGGICFLRNGHLTRYGAIEKLAPGTVFHLTYDRDGSLLVATNSGLVQLHGQRPQKIAPNVIHSAHDALVDRSGTLWVATDQKIVARPQNGVEFHEVSKIETSNMSSLFAEASDGRVWASLKGQLIRLDPIAPESGNLSMRTGTVLSGRLLIDSGGNYWFPNHEAVARWPTEAIAQDTHSQDRVVHAEVYSKADGLNDGPLSIFEDREHNIWIGSLSGIDRFSPSKVIRAVPRCYGLGYALAPGSAGNLWAACGGLFESGQKSLLQIRDGKVVAERPAENFSAAYVDRDGTIWFGGPGQIASFDGHAFVTTPLPDDLRDEHPVQALAKDGSGALWVSVVRHGVYRFVSGQWLRDGPSGLPEGPAIVETADDDGSVWLGYPGNRIARVQGQTVQQFTAADGLDVGNVTAIHRAEGRLWVAGELGFSQLHGARFSSIRTSTGSSIKGVSGIASPGNGELWLNASGGIARIQAEDVRQLIRDPNYAIQPEIFDGLDGVPGEPVEINPTPSAVATTDGRVWFETNGGLVWIDATGSSRNNLAPPITLWALDSGGQRYPNRGQTLDLAALTKSLQFDYGAGSLMVPEHVRFRYKLTGLDRDWQDAGGRREAFYTNLGPGSYTFQVIGSNNDGIWNETGASMVFTIAPAFYQTAWFRALCAAVALAAMFMIFRLRLQQIQRRHEAQNRSRLELAHVARLATLSTMTASITHEVAQPISGMRTNASTCARMLAADPPNVAGAAETLRRAIRDADRASEVITRLRAMFAKKAPILEKVDLNEAAQDVIALSTAELRRGGAVLETDFAEPLSLIDGDRVQLRQVILNLLLNGADAMAGIEDRPRTLRIQTQMRTGDRVQLLVRDAGIGLDPRAIDKLFEPFHTTKAHGLGIGLSISRSIIESHKGELWAKPNDGPGTTFGFFIPCASVVSSDG